MRCKKANSPYVENVVDLVLVEVHVVFLVLLVVVVNLHVVVLMVLRMEIIYVVALAVEIHVVVLVVAVCRLMQTRVFTVVKKAIGHVTVSKNNVTKLV